MPIVGRKQHVDKETGQVVEGRHSESLRPVFARLKLSLDWELVFADDERESNPTSFKFLQMAHAWKNMQAKKTGGSALLSGFSAPSAESETEIKTNDVEMGQDGDDNGGRSEAET